MDMTPTEALRLVFRDTNQSPDYQPPKREFSLGGRKILINPNVPFVIDGRVAQDELVIVTCRGCSKSRKAGKAGDLFDVQTDSDNEILSLTCRECGAEATDDLVLPSGVMLAEEYDAWWEQRRSKAARAARGGA